MALAGLFTALTLSAQSHKVSLQLQDASNGEPVGFATVSISTEKGQPKYTLTDGEGKAVLEKVALENIPSRPKSWATSPTSKAWK